MSLPIAVLAGGLATRLRPITETIPKALIEMVGRPFAEHQVRLFAESGIERIVFLVGYRGEQVREALGDGAKYGVAIEYVFDGPKLLGTGGALQHALPTLGDEFYVIYGDSYLQCDYRAVGRAFQQSGCSALMTVFRNDNQWDPSNVEFAEGRIVQYDKRQRTPSMRHIDYGLGVLHARALQPYPPGEPFDLAQVYQDRLAANDLAAFEVADRFYEIGSPQGIEETRALLAGRECIP